MIFPVEINELAGDGEVREVGVNSLETKLELVYKRQLGKVDTGVDACTARSRQGRWVIIGKRIAIQRYPITDER